MHLVNRLLLMPLFFSLNFCLVRPTLKLGFYVKIAVLLMLQHVNMMQLLCYFMIQILDILP